MEREVERRGDCRCLGQKIITGWNFRRNSPNFCNLTTCPATSFPSTTSKNTSNFGLGERDERSGILLDESCTSPELSPHRFGRALILEAEEGELAMATADQAPDFEEHPPTEPKPQASTTKTIDEAKVSAIAEACRDHDLNALRDLSTSEDGLINDDLRKQAWPILLGSSDEADDSPGSWKEMERHPDEDQVRLDVDRSFVYYPDDESDARKDGRKKELSNVITTVLRRHPLLHYFQGYHDIVQVILLVLGEESAIPAVSRLSLMRIRDFMLPTMSGTEPHLRLLPAILYAANQKLYHHLSHTQPFFALAATLTLYAHDIEDYSDIARLFDFLLASEAVVSLYLFAVIVMSRESELLEVGADEPEMLHFILSKLPKPLDLESLIEKTTALFQKHPPEKLPGRAWARVSPYSVLKTTRNAADLAAQSLEDCERYFTLEAEELKRAEDRKRRQQHLRALARTYRRPAIFTGAAVVVAIFALVLRDSNAQSTLSRILPLFGSLQQKLGEVSRRIFT